MLASMSMSDEALEQCSAPSAGSAAVSPMAITSLTKVEFTSLADASSTLSGPVIIRCADLVPESKVGKDPSLAGELDLFKQEYELHTNKLRTLTVSKKERRLRID